MNTERLLLRRWDLDRDLEPYAAICADPEVMRYIGDGHTATRQETAAAIARYEAEWEARGFGLFAAERRETGDLIGFVGLSRPTFLPEVLPAVEIGWRLRRDTWNQGLATEGARAVLRFAFEDVGLDEVVSIHQAGNDASAAVMRKLGMIFDFETTHPAIGRALHVYRLRRSSVSPAAGRRAAARPPRRPT